MKKEIRWSPTRIENANYCRMKYWLTYIDPDKPKPLRLSAYAKGSMFHDIIEKFWVRHGTPEEARKKSSKKKYSNAEEFTKYVKGQWMKIVVGSKRAKDEKNTIHWRDEQEPWTIKNTLPKTCMPLYDILSREGPPIYSELLFDFSLFGKRFTGRIDEVREVDGKIVIRDYKSGNPWIGEMKLKHDPQLTIYNVGLSALCYADEEFAKTLGVGEERREFMGNPRYVNPNFRNEYFMVESMAIDPDKIKTMPHMINLAERTDNHFFEVIKMIEGAVNAMDNLDIYPERGRKCDGCDMKIVCGERLEDVNLGKLVDKGGQGYFDFAMPAFMRKEPLENPKTTIEQPKMRLIAKRSPKK